MRFVFAGTALLAVVTVVVAVSVVLLGDDEAATPREDGSDYLQEALANQEQRRLRFCVQAVDIGVFGRSMPGDPAVEKLAKERIEDALDEVAEDPLWTRAGRDALEPPVVDKGCPSPPVVFEAGHQRDYAGAEGIFPELGRRVWEPSYYGVFAFIVPPDEYARLFGGGSPATSEEYVAAGDQLFGLTVGVYLTEVQLEDSDYLTDVMTRAVGLKAFSKSSVR
jgi:hypothetical protein